MDDDYDTIFQALSHSTRRKVIRILAEEGPQTYTSLLKKTSLTTGTLNHHLEKMKTLIYVSDSLYHLTETGWRAYQAMIALQKGLSTIGRPSPLELIYRPARGLRYLAEGSRSHFILGWLIGIFSLALAYLATEDVVSLAMNSIIPFIFSILAAKLAYRVENLGRIALSYPATLLPMSFTSIIIWLEPTLLKTLGNEVILLNFLVPKVALVWFFYLLVVCVKYSLNLDFNRAFVSAAVGVFAGKILLDSMNGISLLLG